MNCNFPDTPPLTPQEQDDYWRDLEQNWLGNPTSTIRGPPQPTSLFNCVRNFPRLSRDILSENLLPLPKTPVWRETSFLSEESISPLRNKLRNIGPLPSRLSVDNFSRPITEITDEKNNTISITPKRPVLPRIGQRQLSQQLLKFFTWCWQHNRKNIWNF